MTASLLRTAQQGAASAAASACRAAGDCADDQLVAPSRPIRCVRRRAADVRKFVCRCSRCWIDDLHPSLCHGGLHPRFTLIRFCHRAAAFQANYREVQTTTAVFSIMLMRGALRLRHHRCPDRA